MALVDLGWYTSSVGFTAVTQWVKNTSFNAAAFVRQTAPAVGSERVFVAVVGGKTVNSSEPTLTATRGAKTVDNTVTWQECTGQPALNGDLTNTATWAQVKAAAPAVLGQVIKTTSGGSSLQICTTAGTMGAAEPTFSTTAGTTTGETSAVAVWTSLGAPGGFGVLACPHGRIENALAATWGANGNIFFVADNHTQTVATALTLTLPSTNPLPAKLISFDHLVGSAPPTAATAGATVGVTGNVGIAIVGWGEVNGFTINGGSSAGTSAQITLGSASGNAMLVKNCSLVLRNGSTTTINIGGPGAAASAYVIFDNVAVTFGSAAGQAICPAGNFWWRGGSVAWTTQPTSLFSVTAVGRPFDVLLEGVDFSNVTNALLSANLTSAGYFLVKDCKLNASTSLMSAAPGLGPGIGADVIRSDSGDTIDNAARKRYAGDLTTERTIVRSGGAPVSWKIVTSANSTWPLPFECPPIQIWNDITSGTITITLYGCVTGAPNKDDIWFDVEGFGTASFPLGTFATSGKSTFIGATVACDVDSTSSWGGSPPANLFSMAATFSPVKAGPVSIYLKAAKAGTTFYIDPRPVVTGNKLVSQSYVGGDGSYMSELFAGVSRNRIGIGM